MKQEERFVRIYSQGKIDYVEILAINVIDTV